MKCRKFYSLYSMIFWNEISHAQNEANRSIMNYFFTIFKPVNLLHNRTLQSFHVCELKNNWTILWWVDSILIGVNITVSQSLSGRMMCCWCRNPLLQIHYCAIQRHVLIWKQSTKSILACYVLFRFSRSWCMDYVSSMLWYKSAASLDRLAGTSHIVSTNLIFVFHWLSCRCLW